MRLLPPAVYCNVRKAGLIWSDKRRHGTRVRFVSRDGLLVACYRGHEFHFYAPERVRRYVWPQGIDKKKTDMIEKYRVDELYTDSRSGSVAIDIGANVGELTLALAERFDTVIAVEPDPLAYECLVKNTANLPNVHTYQVAISAMAESREFYLSSTGADSSLYPPDRWTDKLRIRSVPVSDLLDDAEVKEVTLLKVEAEGAEPEVLDGASSIFHRIAAVTVDCSPERGGQDTMDACWERLESAGFSVSRSGWTLVGYR